MANADQDGRAKPAAQKLLLPTAVSVAAAGAGVLLTSKRSKVREALPEIKNLGVGDLAEDLRGKLDKVLGKNDSSSRHESAAASAGFRRVDADELRSRRRERAERRSRRRRGSGA